MYSKIQLTCVHLMSRMPVVWGQQAGHQKSTQEARDDSSKEHGQLPNAGSVGCPRSNRGRRLAASSVRASGGRRICLRRRRNMRPRVLAANGTGSPAHSRHPVPGLGVARADGPDVCGAARNGRVGRRGARRTDNRRQRRFGADKQACPGRRVFGGSRIGGPRTNTWWTNGIRIAERVWWVRCGGYGSAALSGSTIRATCAQVGRALGPFYASIVGTGARVAILFRIPAAVCAQTQPIPVAGNATGHAGGGSNVAEAFLGPRLPTSVHGGISCWYCPERRPSLSSLTIALR
jgi:hypothetical protein